MDINEINEDLLRANWNENSYLKRIDFLSQLNPDMDSNGLVNFKSNSTLMSLISSQDKILDKRIDELDFLEICRAVIKADLEDIQREVELKVNAHTELNTSISNEALDHLLDESNIRRRVVENNLAYVDKEIQDKLITISKEIALSNFLNEKGVELEHQQKSKIEILKNKFINSKTKASQRKHEDIIKVLNNELTELVAEYKGMLAKNKEHLKMFISDSRENKATHLNSNREAFKGANELLSDYQTKISSIEKSISDKKLQIELQESILNNYKQQGLIGNSNKEFKKNRTISKYDLNRFMDPINQDNKNDKTGNRENLSKPNVLKNNQNKGKGRRM